MTAMSKTSFKVDEIADTQYVCKKILVSNQQGAGDRSHPSTISQTPKSIRNYETFNSKEERGTSH